MVVHVRQPGAAADLDAHGPGVCQRAAPGGKAVEVAPLQRAVVAVALRLELLQHRQRQKKSAMLGTAPRQAASHGLVRSATVLCRPWPQKRVTFNRVAHPLPVVLHNCLMGSDSPWMAAQGWDATGAWTATQMLLKGGRRQVCGSRLCLMSRSSQQLGSTWLGRWDRAGR